MAKENLKSEYARKLIENGIPEYSVVRHSYTNNRLNGKIDQVQSVNRNLSPTLDTRCDCLGVVVNDPIEMEKNMGKEKNQFTDIEKELFTEDGNIKRYLGSDKVDEFKEGQMATTTFPNGYGHGPRTHNESIALNTIDRPVVKHNLRIRKLTPCECLKLMGFEKEDYEILKHHFSDNKLYHMAGDSLVVSLMACLLGQMLPIQEKDLMKAVENYTDGLTK